MSIVHCKQRCISVRIEVDQTRMCILKHIYRHAVYSQHIIGDRDRDHWLRINRCSKCKTVHAVVHCTSLAFWFKLC